MRAKIRVKRGRSSSADSPCSYHLLSCTIRRLPRCPIFHTERRANFVDDVLQILRILSLKGRGSGFVRRLGPRSKDLGVEEVTWHMVHSSEDAAAAMRNAAKISGEVSGR